MALFQMAWSAACCAGRRHPPSRGPYCCQASQALALAA